MSSQFSYKIRHVSLPISTSMPAKASRGSFKECVEIFQMREVLQVNYGVAI